MFGVVKVNEIDMQFGLVFGYLFVALTVFVAGAYSFGLLADLVVPGYEWIAVSIIVFMFACSIFSYVMLVKFVRRHA